MKDERPTTGFILRALAVLLLILALTVYLTVHGRSLWWLGVPLTVPMCAFIGVDPVRIIWAIRGKE